MNIYLSKNFSDGQEFQEIFSIYQILIIVGLKISFLWMQTLFQRKLIKLSSSGVISLW